MLNPEFVRINIIVTALYRLPREDVLRLKAQLNRNVGDVLTHGLLINGKPDSANLVDSVSNVDEEPTES